MTSWAGYPVTRRTLIGGLTGTVLELGPGHGANFDHLRSDIEWIGLEPHAGSRRKLDRAAAGRVRTHQVLAAQAEQIPLPDASVDAVLATVVLCSVADQHAVLAEVRRVLRPGGRFVFFEHIAAPRGTALYRLQRVASPFTRLFDRGCNPARRTDATIESAGFATVELEYYESPGHPRFPYVAGTATV